MRVLLRSVAVLLVAIAIFLIYAVINAMASDGGAKPGVAIGYIIGAIIAVAVAARLWRGRAAGGRAVG